MTNNEMKAIIEGLLFVSGEEGIELSQLESVLQKDKETIKDQVNILTEEFKQKERGIQIVELGGNYILTTKEEHADYFKKLVQSPTTATLSQAALETLAIIAYKQPISRVEIEDIRGVKSERPVRTLQGKVLIKEVGRVEGTGRAILYGTTKEFLEHFGLRSIEELPPLPEDVEEDDIEGEADLFFEKFQEQI
ncbi:SMC-Scp complex subunit ScpB [Alteribacter aurantiacus]|uniref:SMC-Scp complex subunit ScpB n=1 Tax=Alteribacter aurantiacus TaxID=254410 RepID=UPI000413D58B|nr:SMC-Scp complex subunit ScpB [Alteribacter aurantiacus]